MAMEDNNESCGSRAVESPKKSRQRGQKLEVYNDVLTRLYDMNHEDTQQPDFEDQLWIHFNRLPPRYALDVNVERAEDVITHKRVLQMAEDPANRPAFEVRLVQVHPTSDVNTSDFDHMEFSMKEDAQSPLTYSSRSGLHPPPSFGSAQNLEALALKANRHHDDRYADNDVNSTSVSSRPMHEITFSTIDRPKLLSQLTSLLSEAGLNIQEAHAFSTADGFSLDVFVVDGWPHEETAHLRSALTKEIMKSKGGSYVEKHSSSTTTKNVPTSSNSLPSKDHVKIPTDGTDVWEIDAKMLKFENKVASGSFGDLYKGTYCSQEVAIKVLKPERIDADMLREFSQEVFIMRKIRHKNVVQFIGACTEPSKLCIVTEFMARGSIYNYLHKQNGSFKIPLLLKIAIDISKGMSYLHQNNIIHRDLKTANLLMDEHEKYDPDPAAKAAAASVLASKLGADSGLKVFLGDESQSNAHATEKSSDVELQQSSCLRKRNQSNAKSPRSNVGQHSDKEMLQNKVSENSPHDQLVVEHHNPAALGGQDGGWLARIAALLVGEDPTQSYALICGNCHMHLVQI